MREKRREEVRTGFTTFPTLASFAGYAFFLRRIPPLS